MTDLIPITLIITIFIVAIITSLSTLWQIENDTIMPLINSYNECLNNTEGNDCITYFFHECNKLNKRYVGTIVINCETLFTNKLGSYSDLWSYG